MNKQRNLIVTKTKVYLHHMAQAMIDLSKGEGLLKKAIV
jgi:hypothetical protein